MPSDAQDDARRLSRRDFLGLGRRAGIDVLKASAALNGVVEHQAPAAPDPSLLFVGTGESLAGMPLGSVSTEFAGSGQFYLVRVAEGVLALHRRCPGQGCAVLWRPSLPALAGDRSQGWEAGQFVCLAHGVQFDRYGVPAVERDDVPGAMTRLSFVVREGDVAVRLSLQEPDQPGQTTLFACPPVAATR